MCAAGFHPGDAILNKFSYHLTPGGFIFDSSARALYYAIIPADPGNTEQQFELIEAYRPIGYSGTPDFLKMLLDAGAAAGHNRCSIPAITTAGHCSPRRKAKQAFGRADLGIVAYESAPNDGMVVNEDLYQKS